MCGKKFGMRENGSLGYWSGALKLERVLRSGSQKDGHINPGRAALAAIANTIETASLETGWVTVSRHCVRSYTDCRKCWPPATVVSETFKLTSEFVVRHVEERR